MRSNNPIQMGNGKIWLEAQTHLAELMYSYSTFLPIPSRIFLAQNGPWQFL